MEILIVDDSKAMRMIVKRTLRQAGFDGHSIREAGNGVEALTAIEALTPKLVLCDWNMPEMTGLELLTELAARGTVLKFGFITSESTDEMRQTAMDNGAEFLITKPFNADTFRTTLGPLLG